MIHMMGGIYEGYFSSTEVLSIGSSPMDISFTEELSFVHRFPYDGHFSYLQLVFVYYKTKKHIRFHY